MNARLRILASSGLFCIAAAAHAQLPLQPGLWEETMSTKSDDPKANAAMAQMQEKLAAMPPDQRKMVEQMMASRGIGMGGAPNSMRVCLTKEQIARDFVPDGNNGHCSHKRIDQSGNATKFSFTCEGREQVNGQGVFTLVDSKSFTVVTDADMLMQGKPSHMHVDLAGHFVASDCGDVKPVAPPSAR